MQSLSSYQLGGRQIPVRIEFSDTSLQKVNEHCFERAIPNPGSSISSSEQTTFTNCMEKYMAAWNTTSRQYLGHLQKGAGAGGM
jgi:hypothetical protein